MPAATPVVDDFNCVASVAEGPKEVHSESSIEMLNEDVEVGKSTLGRDSVINLVVLFVAIRKARRHILSRCLSS